ncbi:MAG: hypothetical protein H7A53_11230 [Akkermansiaceae bacterium]|nr:hypothetical protein [Akkermansiaceae bacterium]
MKLFAWFRAMILVAAVISSAGWRRLAWRSLTGLANLVASDSPAPYRIRPDTWTPPKGRHPRPPIWAIRTLRCGAFHPLAIAGVTLDAIWRNCRRANSGTLAGEGTVVS